ncbi:undecaprenyl diphosphate synthase family protein [Desulfobacterium sp. N47]|uniref:Isoprenyl transferase n=1 Tax=uncultured Desulfobacterium sp. TaxID=201089 RepID=E1Y8U8_9BACT|nr:Undecaprenyl pyrophosphate synthetase [uncultured Desulfobacterium sp.]
MNSRSLPGLYGLDSLNLPKHIAIIMDGNGRWAEKRLMNRIKGHEAGSGAVRTIVRACREIGISVLTLYAFSTENWQRPKIEISALMVLLNKFLESEKNEMMENDIRLNAIGQVDKLPENVRKTLNRTMDLTGKNKGMLLNLALSYGGRTEIVDMVKIISQKVKDSKIDPDLITDEFVADHLYTAGMPYPDLLIRTSGEMRISNFLLWQIAYSEIFITDTLWPDFGKEELIKIIYDFQNRERRFGNVG